MSKTRPKWEVVTRAMARGVEVNLHDGFYYTFHEGQLCHKIFVYKTADGQLKEEPEEVQWAVSDMSLNTFMKLCEQIPCDKLVGIGFSSAMKSMHNSPFNPTKWED